MDSINLATNIIYFGSWKLMTHINMINRCIHVQAKLFTNQHAQKGRLNENMIDDTEVLPTLAILVLSFKLNTPTKYVKSLDQLRVSLPWNEGPLVGATLPSVILRRESKVKRDTLNTRIFL
jgi:hypothetical protein